MRKHGEMSRTLTMALTMIVVTTTVFAGMSCVSTTDSAMTSDFTNNSLTLSVGEQFYFGDPDTGVFLFEIVHYNDGVPNAVKCVKILSNIMDIRMLVFPLEVTYDGVLFKVVGPLPGF